jgi:AraC-like DNA-binding protein
MKPKTLFEPHLMINEAKLPKSGEWAPNFRGWCFLQIKSGISYWQERGGAQEVSAGSALVLARQTRGGLCASQLSEVDFTYFCLEPEKLSGLLTLGEQHSLKTAAAREKSPVRMLPPTHPISERFKKLCLSPRGANLSARLQLLQLFVDLLECELEGGGGNAGREMDGRGRLRELLSQMAAAEFVELSLADLAPKMCCSPRHVSRLFREELGTSFREKQTELRLVRACELLANSNAKVVEVALTSGYQSNSLFNLVFKKHFGVSPGEWRRQNNRSSPPGPKQTRLLSV